MVLLFNEKVVNLRSWQFYLENSLFTFIISMICFFLVKLFTKKNNNLTYEYFNGTLLDKLQGETRSIIKTIYEIEKVYIGENYSKKYLDNVRNLGGYNINLIKDSCNKCVNINDYITLIKIYNDKFLKLSKNLVHDQIIQCKAQCQLIIKKVKIYNNNYKNILKNNVSETTLNRYNYLLDRNRDNYIFRIVEVTNKQMDNIYNITNNILELCSDIHGKIIENSNQLKNITNNNLENYIDNVKDKIRDNIESLVAIGKGVLRSELDYGKQYLRLVSELGDNQLKILSDLELIKCNSEQEDNENSKNYLIEKTDILQEDIIYTENILEEKGVDCELSLDQLQLGEECLSLTKNETNSNQPIEPKVGTPLESVQKIDRYGILDENDDKCKSNRTLPEYQIISEEEVPLLGENQCSKLIPPSSNYKSETETETETEMESKFTCPPGYIKKYLSPEEELSILNKVTSEEIHPFLPPNLIVDGLKCTDPKYNKLGLYHLVANKKINQRGVWKREGDEVYIYYNSNNNWIFGKRQDMEEGSSNGWIFANSDSESPHLVETNWFIYSSDNDLRRVDSNITCEENWDNCGWRVEPNLRIRSIKIDS